MRNVAVIIYALITVLFIFANLLGLGTGIPVVTINILAAVALIVATVDIAFGVIPTRRVVA